MSKGLGDGVTLVSLWMDNSTDCKRLGAVLQAARRGEIPGVGDYRKNQGFVVTNVKAALEAMQLGREEGSK